MAAKLSTADGIEYRYGPSAAAYGATGNEGRPTLSARPDHSFDPIAWSVGGKRGCHASQHGGFCGTWQLGGPLQAKVGDYSSSIAHAAYVADTPETSVGVASFQALAMANNTYSQKPEPSWTTYYGDNREGFDDFHALDYGTDARKAIAIGRCYRQGWCSNSLMAFQSGLIGGTGSNTAYNRASLKLPAGKVPTGIVLTHSSEFALVTIWDTVNIRGQVAVIALGGQTAACRDGNCRSDFWGEWRGFYPGLPNLGNIGYMKLLGFIDLPDEMRAPTEISASTGLDHTDYLYMHKPQDFLLDDAAVRQAFNDGEYRDRTARAGVAVVISKSERRAAVIDLGPLFRYYRAQYFAASQADFDQRQASAGEGPGQWPYRFEAQPSQMPTVAKVIAFEHKPTAVNVLAKGPGRAFVATQQGQLHIFDLGGYLDPDRKAGAEQIARLSSVMVGRNPTGITYPKMHGLASDSRRVYKDSYKREVIVTSRGDRRIDFVKFAADYNSGAVRGEATIVDADLVDPISSEDADTHGTEGYVLSVADYGGRRVSNYRYGPVIFHTNPGMACAAPAGCPVQGPYRYELGGRHPLPGGPFHINGANIP
ncbi:hypothetical protein ABB29_07450 [Pseudoxanthomonas dokdonensis]|uniref:Uncharacterized protein n=2 Tax=Pseudoxanthomonas dokdonensis TaxID=344882 RepID=A0A0R0CJE3_9GAMM|nr:hypothetical protein ABB29_07450 [Pseudoxanthomonas dokdonensis]